MFVYYSRFKVEPTQPVREHEPSWPSPNDQDIDLRVNRLRYHSGVEKEGIDSALK